MIILSHMFVKITLDFLIYTLLTLEEPNSDFLSLISNKHKGIQEITVDFNVEHLEPASFVCL